MPPENALSVEWVDEPYQKLVAEARRVGAFDGFGPHSLGRCHAQVCCTPESAAQCIYEREVDGAFIWIRDTKGTPIRAWFLNPDAHGRVVEVAKTCPFHRGISDPAVHMETLLAEFALVKRFQDMLPVEMSWVFTPRRALVIDLRGLETAKDGNAIRALALTPEFVGKVIVNG